MNNSSLPGASAEGQVAPAEDTSFASMLSEFEREHGQNGHDQAMEGRVVSITAEQVFVDIGRKMEGVLPVAQFRDASGALMVKSGDALLVSVIRKATICCPPSGWSARATGALLRPLSPRATASPAW